MAQVRRQRVPIALRHNTSVEVSALSVQKVPNFFPADIADGDAGYCTSHLLAFMELYLVKEDMIQFVSFKTPFYLSQGVGGLSLMFHKLQMQVSKSICNYFLLTMAATAQQLIILK